MNNDHINKTNYLLVFKHKSNQQEVNGNRYAINRDWCQLFWKSKPNEDV